MLWQKVIRSKWLMATCRLKCYVHVHNGRAVVPPLLETCRCSVQSYFNTVLDKPRLHQYNRLSNPLSNRLKGTAIPSTRLYKPLFVQHCCIVYTNIQPLVKPVWQPVWQTAVSCIQPVVKPVVQPGLTTGWTNSGHALMAKSRPQPGCLPVTSSPPDSRTELWASWPWPSCRSTDSVGLAAATNPLEFT